MYTQEELTRIVELFHTVEGRKAHEYAVPTYRDSPALQEMGEIILSREENTVAVLEEKLPVLWYLAKAYGGMWRWAIAMKYYKLLLQAYGALFALRPYSREELQQLEDAFYNAVKARNMYGPDACQDLHAIVADCLPEARRNKLMQSAQESRRGLPKNDPVELTEAYLAVIDLVEEKIEKNRKLDFCHETWSLQAQYLAEYGIYWQSPAILNPGFLFD